ncbi:WD40 repeat-like protein [Wallemia mellicola]|uniref:WD40 repeat-like protein n=1 Tax=Wallemia mellicola TaxID=1708541 RepID=A0A4T0PDR1_9BASI|nr:WD40 repeat-like protein [Wallemia mellicola]TIC15289.1 WD40 repeat-like protein [Wallemia mellicola]TIC23272.1 WD40 repeat-like protein [Wallemia mellicola]TIC49073.1 WD40 repeat-like protein [Wallemia mellicola]
MDYRKTLPLPQTFSHKLGYSQDAKYFKSFKSTFVKEFAPITSVSFSPISPHRFAVTSATRVQIYTPRSQSVVKTISRFKDVARSGQIRSDGRLVVAGDDSGLVQVFDINSRAILRTFEDHKQPVHVTSFHPTEQTKVLSASDDCSVILHDIPSQSALQKFDEHSDYVRTAAFSPSSPYLLVSGSYDHTVKLWDTRMQESAMTMSTGGMPVESTVFLPGGETLATSSGPIVRIWDIMAGGRCRRAFSNHQKAVTSLAIDGDQKRLLTGGLDQMVKVYDLETFRVTHSMRFPAPVLSVATSPDNINLVAGLSDGTLAMRRRQAKGNEVAEKIADKEAMKSGAYEYMQEAQSLKPKSQVAVKSAGNLGSDEFKIEPIRRLRLKEFDKFLKKFQYSEALDSVLRKKASPATTFALLLELINRDGLKQAISGRDDIGLEPLVSMLVKWIVDPRFTDVAVPVASAIIDIYGGVVGQSQLIDNLLTRLRKKVDDEIKVQNEFMNAKGALDMIFAQSTLR